MTDNLGNKAIKGTIWATIDRMGTMGLQFIVNLILARLLLPADFGAIEMIMIFILVSQVFIDGGFGSALIQRKDSDQTDFSTIFYWNLGVGLALYGIIYISAPLIAQFYALPILSDVLRVLGLLLVTNSIISIQTTRLQKVLAFRQLAVINISATFLGGILALYMAYAGYGVWSLVALMLSSGALRIIMFYFVTRWLPSLTFSIASLKRLFRFGGYLLCANLLQTACQNIQGLIIGKRFSASQLGYYSQASKLNSIAGYTLPQIIVQVMYPVYSQIQDERERLIATMLMNFRVIAFAIFPLLFTLILIAQPLIDTLYGGIWAPCVPYFRILCVGSIFTCLTNINYYAVAAVGKSRQLFLWSFYKWGMMFTLLIVAMYFGMTALMWAIVASNFNIFMVNAFLSRRWVGLSLKALLMTVMPIGALATILLALLWLPGIFGIHINWIILTVAYLSLYLALAQALRFKAMRETIEVVRRLRSR